MESLSRALLSWFDQLRLQPDVEVGAESSDPFNRKPRHWGRLLVAVAVTAIASIISSGCGDTDSVPDVAGEAVKATTIKPLPTTPPQPEPPAPGEEAAEKPSVFHLATDLADGAELIDASSTPWGKASGSKISSDQLLAFYGGRLAMIEGEGGIGYEFQDSVSGEVSDYVWFTDKSLITGNAVVSAEEFRAIAQSIVAVSEDEWKAATGAR